MPVPQLQHIKFAKLQGAPRSAPFAPRPVASDRESQSLPQAQISVRVEVNLSLKGWWCTDGFIYHLWCNLWPMITITITSIISSTITGTTRKAGFPLLAKKSQALLPAKNSYHKYRTHFNHFQGISRSCSLFTRSNSVAKALTKGWLSHSSAACTTARRSVSKRLQAMNQGISGVPGVGSGSGWSGCLPRVSAARNVAIICCYLLIIWYNMRNMFISGNLLLKLQKGLLDWTGLFNSVITQLHMVLQWSLFHRSFFLDYWL